MTSSSSSSGSIHQAQRPYITQSVPVEVDPPPPETRSSSDDPPLVLLVDDEPKNLQLAGSLLRHEGFDIALAANGEEAIEAAREDQPDVIVLDIMMPQMDGLEVCRILKSDPETAGIPIIFLTARSEEDDIVQGFRAGGEDYVTKPFRPRELTLRVRTQIRLRRAETGLRRANAQLKEVNANQARFFSIIAHDLRQPMTGFRTFAKLLESGGETLSLEDVLAVCEDFKGEAERTHQVLQNLLSWVDMRLGQITFEPRRVRLTHAFELAIKPLDSVIRAKQLLVRNDLPQALCVLADGEMVVGIFQQLISNAALYTPRGGRLRLEAVPHGERVAISVEDNGRGMTEEEVQNLFRLEKVRPRQGKEATGSGLGLVLVQAFVEQHGGQIQVESGENAGTRVTFTLPAAPEKTSASLGGS